jgi:membrane protein YdbS with pleckstrin-like domain
VTRQSEEHEFEAQHGLPEPLPAGERILWQGSPDVRAMAERAFHVRTLAIYFGLILLARATTVVAQGGSVADSLVAALWLLPAAAGALAMLVVMAYFTSRTTVYTITDQRVVMRVGIVLSVTFNLPFSRIAAASANLKRGPIGDIALTLDGADQIAYVHLWPHARPWQIRRTEPMLRCVADAAQVSRILAKAWSAARGIEVAESSLPVVARPEAQHVGAGRIEAGGAMVAH